MIEEILANTQFLETTMREAIKLAKASLPADIPVGAVILDSKTKEIVSASSNTKQRTKDPTNHCEVITIRKLCKEIDDWRLNNYIMFTTLEPCIMCASVLMQARIGAVVYGAHDPQYGAAGSIYNFFTDERFNHNAKVVGGILEDECKEPLDAFFASRRNKKL